MAGQRLEDWDWVDLRAYVKHAPETSALFRVTHDDWWVTPELKFLRDMEQRLSWLVWAQTSDAKYNRNIPQRVPLTAAERRAAQPEREKYHPKPVAEILAWLGWKQE